MAESEKIKSTDIIQKDIFKNTVESTEELTAALDELEEGFTAILKTQQKILSQNAKNSKQIREQNEALRAAQAARKGLATVQKTQLDLDLKEEKLKQQKIKTSIEEGKLRRAEVKEKADQIKASEKLAAASQKLQSVYAQESKRLNDLRKQYKDLVLQGKGAETETKALLADITKLDKKLKDVDAAVGQFNRHIGDYKNAIGEAIEESGLLTGTLGELTRGLNEIKKKFKEASEEGKGFGTALKLGAVAAAALALKLLSDIDQAVADGLEIAKAGAADLLSIGGNANVTLVKQTIAFRDELRRLQEELQLTTLDQEDFNEIAQDNTIGFEARNAALQESIRLGKIKAETDVKIAEGEVNLARLQVEADKQNAKFSGKAREESLKKLSEAQEKLNEAIDRQDDLVRQNDEAQRKFNVEQAGTEIDLILKKQQSANADKAILESKLADERRQLEERRKIAAQLLSVNRKTTAEEIKIFKEKTGLQFNESELLAEKDAILLQRKLEGIKQTIINQKGETEQVGIGTDAVILLAKIVKQAQENEIDNAERLKKLREEEIKQLQRIADIQKEIGIIKKQGDVEQAQETLAQAEKLNDDLNEKILIRERVFNSRRLRTRKLAAERVKELESNLAEEQIRLLELQMARDKKAIDDNIHDEKIKAQEKLKIEEKFQQDRAKIIRDTQQKLSDEDKKELEERKQIELRRTEIVTEELQKVTNAFSDELDKRNQKRIDEADRELEQRQQAIEKQTKLAEEGKTNQLGFELAAEEQAQLRKKELEEKAAREAEAVALAQSYEAFLLARLKEADADPNQAPFLALKDTLLARGVAKGLVQFANEGNDWVEALPGQSAPKGKDSIPFLLAPEEAVIKADANNEHHDAVVALNSGLFDKLFMPKSEAVRITDADIQNSEFLHALNRIESEIRNKPVQMWEVDKFGYLVKKEIIDHFTRSTKYKPYRKFTD